MAIQIVDTHVHLHMHQFAADRADVLARAAAAGVTRVIEIGYNVESSRAAVALAEQHPQITAVVGLQANSAAEAEADWFEQVAQLATHPRVVAIGEIGLDYYHDRAPHPVQEDIFRKQLILARELNKPVVIHTRDAHADTVRILQDAARGQAGVMHSFSGDWAFASACLDVGFYLSFSGPLTYSKATELHDVARRMPLDRVLVETDSPYLAPNPHRGQRNEPAHVRRVAERLAALRNEPLESVAAALWDNTLRIFGPQIHVSADAADYAEIVYLSGREGGLRK